MTPEGKSYSDTSDFPIKEIHSPSSPNLSLARTIAIIEITMAGEAFMKSKGITWPLFYTGVFYLAFVGLLTLLFSFIERKLSYFK